MLGLGSEVRVKVRVRIGDRVRSRVRVRVRDRVRDRDIVLRAHLESFSNGKRLQLLVRSKITSYLKY